MPLFRTTAGYPSVQVPSVFTSPNEKDGYAPRVRNLRVPAKQTRRGFTLIELLVVIAIIGILSSVVLASLTTARMKSRDARRVSDIRQLQTALTLYYDSNAFTYPTAAQFTSSLAPTYIQTLPKDPSTNANYVYSASGVGMSCTGYHLGAVLEDSSNQALSSDADAAVVTPCTGGSPDFAGASAACTATAGTDKCFDVKP